MIVGVMTLSKVPQKISVRAMRESCRFVLTGNHASLIVSAALATLALSSLAVGAQTEGRHPPIAAVGQDGNPYTAVHYLVRLNAQATNWKPCDSAKSGPAKDRSPSFSAAISTSSQHPRRLSTLNQRLSTVCLPPSLKLPTATP